jgi:hypothetical protein
MRTLYLDSEGPSSAKQTQTRGKESATGTQQEYITQLAPALVVFCQDDHSNVGTVGMETEN